MSRVLTVGVVCVALSAALGGQPPAPESDRYIKLGTRIPEVPAGEGGELQVIADPTWCREAGVIMEVRLARGTGYMPVVRLPTRPSDCSWQFERMPVGRYDAVILSAEREDLLAIGHGALARGTTTLITVEPSANEIEGQLTSAQRLPSPLRLRFTVGPSTQWTTRVGPDGTYRVRVGDVAERTTLAVWAEPDGEVASESTRAFNVFHLASAVIFRGLVRLDIDHVTLPPVVIHVEVPPVPGAGYDDFAEASFDGARGPGFKVRNGLRGQALAEYGRHFVRVLTNDRQRVLAAAEIAVAEPETEAHVVLRAAGR